MYVTVEHEESDYDAKAYVEVNGTGVEVDVCVDVCVETEVDIADLVADNCTAVDVVGLIDELDDAYDGRFAPDSIKLMCKRMKSQALYDLISELITMVDVEEKQ
jgi:hypothetical protein